MEALFDLSDKVAEQLLTNPKLLLSVLLLLTGWLLKCRPGFPNRFIPPALIFTGGLLFIPIGLLMGESGKLAFNIATPYVPLFVRGCVIGMLVWISHDKVLRHFEGVIPGLSDALKKANAAGQALESPPSPRPSPQGEGVEPTPTTGTK